MNEQIKNVLKNSGLSEKEIEIFILLNRKRLQKGTEIAKQLKMNRGQVYRILKSLERKSFVEATLERPKRFIALPLKGVLDSFIKSRREEVARIEESKQNLLADWEKVSQERIESPLEKFSVVEGNKRILHKISQMLEKTNNCFSVLLDLRHIIRADQYGVFNPSIFSSRPKIEFRILTHASKQNLKAIKILHKELHHLGIIKALDTNIGTSNFSKMVIRDNDEIALFISKEGVNPKKEISLCTTSKSIISAFSKVFEELWNSSKYINERITEIETGKSIPKTQLIKDPEFARETYFEILNCAQKEIMIVTSSKGLSRLLKNKSQFEDWFKSGVSIKIMAPIVNKNLDIAQQLLKWSEVRHIPLGYFETIIVDENHLFQFRHMTTDHENSFETHFFENMFYTNDYDYVKKTKNLLYELWRKTHTPSNAPLQSIKFQILSEETHVSLRRIWINGQGNIEFLPKRRISEKDFINKFDEVKKYPTKNWSKKHWSDTMIFLGSRAYAIIHPPEFFSLPKLIIGLWKNIGASSFGEENILKVFLKTESPKNAPYHLVAHVQDNANSLEYRRAKLAGIVNPKKLILVNKGQLNVRVQGNTLFGGWTIPVRLGNSKFVLPPSCILFEGYGQVRSGIFNLILPSERREECWFNNVNAFVTFFHPRSKYIGSGTEGMLDRKTIQYSRPPKL